MRERETVLFKYLNVKLVLVSSDVNERHLRETLVVVRSRKVSPRDVRVAEQVDLDQLAVDQPPGVNDGALEGVAPQDRVFFGLTDDPFGDDGFDLILKKTFLSYLSLGVYGIGVVSIPSLSIPKMFQNKLY